MYKGRSVLTGQCTLTDRCVRRILVEQEAAGEASGEKLETWRMQFQVEEPTTGICESLCIEIILPAQQLFSTRTRLAITKNRQPVL